MSNYWLKIQKPRLTYCPSKLKSTSLFIQQYRNMSLIVSPPETLKGALTIPEKTLLGPGPSNVPERILKAMALPTIGHLHPEFCKVMDDCKAGVQYAFQTKVSN